jgi:hypothetical protein
MRAALTKGLRTFLAGMAGTLTTLVALDVFTDLEQAATVLALGTLTSVLGGVLSFTQNAAGASAVSTPLGKAWRTFYQVAAAGLATVGVTELTSEAISDLGLALGRVGVAALLSGGATWALNAAEAE